MSKYALIKLKLFSNGKLLVAVVWAEIRFTSGLNSSLWHPHWFLKSWSTKGLFLPLTCLNFFLFFCSFQLGHGAAWLWPGLRRWHVCEQAEKENGDQPTAVWGDDRPAGERQWAAGRFSYLHTHQTIDEFLTMSLRYWKLNLAAFPFCWCWSFISEVLWLYLTRVPCVLAGEPPRGQTAAKGGRRAHQGGFWLLEPQEEKQQGQLTHPHRQAGEAGWLQHQRPLRGLPTSHWENANQKGLWMVLFFFLSVFVSL